MALKIPKYVDDLLSRSEFEFDFCKSNKDYAAGYTIRIRKRSAYQLVGTFNEEIERLVKWANRQVEETAYILEQPVKTHYCGQFAIVTIFDPIMQKIEHLIPKN